MHFGGFVPGASGPHDRHAQTIHTTGKRRRASVPPPPPPRTPSHDPSRPGAAPHTRTPAPLLHAGAVAEPGLAPETPSLQQHVRHRRPLRGGMGDLEARCAKHGALNRQ